MSRVFAQQPVPGPILPAEYLIIDRTCQLRPPMMRFGWRLGHDKLMELVKRYFPAAIERRYGPLTAGLLFDDEAAELGVVEDIPEEAWSEMNDNIIDTILGPHLVVEVCKFLGIPLKCDRMVRVVPLYNSELEDEWGLTIGTNHLGIPPRYAIAKLQELISTVDPNEPAMWYLDHIEWRWSRVPPKACKRE